MAICFATLRGAVWTTVKICRSTGEESAHRLPPICALATDDAHGYHEFGVGKVNPGRGWVMVQAPHLSGEAIVRAMERGHFYSSSGVTLRDVRHADGTLTVTIPGQEGVRYRTQVIATLRSAPLSSEPVRDAELDVARAYSKGIGKVVAEVEGVEAAYRLAGQELYVRAKVISSKPHPNPYAKDDVELAWTQPVAP